MDYLKTFIHQHIMLRKEHLAIIMACLLFLLFPILIRKLDPTAAPIDLGALSAILMAVLALFIFKLTTWWSIQLIWPVFAGYANYHFEINFKSLLPWQKITLFLSFYCLLLFAFILILMAIM